MDLKKKVLFLCTENACRSQVAHGLLNYLASSYFDVFSAGSHPSQVHPMSIKVMDEIGIDISKYTSDPVNKYLNKSINIVITVCNKANSVCPVFPENIEGIHWSIDDPFQNWNSDFNQLRAFRKTRKEIKSKVVKFIQAYEIGK